MQIKKIFSLVTGHWLLVTVLCGCAGPGTYVPARISHPDIPGIYHKVEAGQTLWRIAKFYDVEISEIVRINRVPDAERIAEGQLLFIPGQDRAKKIAISSSFIPDRADFVWPVKGKVINFFGSRKEGVFNKGIDISAGKGASIVAARGGNVVFCDPKFKGLGKTLIIDHGDGFSTVYAHNSAILVKAGQYVKEGEVIARVGTSGNASQPSLHFEIRRRGRAENPFYYLP